MLLIFLSKWSLEISIVSPSFLACTELLDTSGDLKILRM